MKARRYVLTAMLICMGSLMTASIGRAELNADVRVKLGSSAGIEKVEFTNIMSGDATEDGGGNFQIELMLSDASAAGPTFVGGVGLFSRTHKGNVPDPFLPLDVEYDAVGLSGTVGVGIPVNPNFHMEGRVELDLGAGKPTLSTPGFAWNSVQEDSYTALDLIFGGYYTISKPGLQIGLELGVQSFTGNFQIWNNGGFWNDAKVEGSGGIINFVIGGRF